MAANAYKVLRRTRQQISLGLPPLELDVKENQDPDSSSIESQAASPTSNRSNRTTNSSTNPTDDKPLTESKASSPTSTKSNLTATSSPKSTKNKSVTKPSPRGGKGKAGAKTSSNKTQTNAPPLRVPSFQEAKVTAKSTTALMQFVDGLGRFCVEETTTLSEQLPPHLAAILRKSDSLLEGAAAEEDGSKGGIGERSGGDGEEEDDYEFDDDPENEKILKNIIQDTNLSLTRLSQTVQAVLRAAKELDGKLKPLRKEAVDALKAWQQKASEKQKNDPSTWPTCGYKVSGPNNLLAHDMGLYVKAHEDDFKQEAIEVHTESLFDQDCDVITEDDDVISNTIRVQSNVANVISSRFRMFVSVPIEIARATARNSSQRAPVMLCRTPQKAWHTVPAKRVYVDDIVCLETRLRDIRDDMRFIVINRRQFQQLDDSQDVVRAEVDPEVRFHFLRKRASEEMQIQVLPVGAETFTAIRGRREELKLVAASSPIVRVQAAALTEPTPVSIRLPLRPPPFHSRAALIVVRSKTVVIKTLTSGSTDIFTEDGDAKHVTFRVSDIRTLARVQAIRVDSYNPTLKYDRLAQLIQAELYKVKVNCLVRQRSRNMKEACVQLCSASDVERQLADMEQQGYDTGPAPSPVFYIHRRDQLVVRLAGNLGLVGDRRTLVLPYFDDFERRTFGEEVVVGREGVHQFDGRLEVLPLPVYVHSDKAGRRVALPRDPYYTTPLFIIQPTRRDHLTKSDHEFFTDAWLKYVAHLVSEPAKLKNALKVPYSGNAALKHPAYSLLTTWKGMHYDSADRRVRVLCKALRELKLGTVAAGLEELERLFKDVLLVWAFHVLEDEKNGMHKDQWPHLARQLGSSEADIKEIKKLKLKPRESLHAVLLQWRREVGERASIPGLVRALEEIGLILPANALRDFKYDYIPTASEPRSQTIL